MEQDDHWKCLVQQNGVGYNRYTCMFPKEPINGSHFGCCTCKRDKTLAAPCDHMVAAVQSGKLPTVITTVSIMPWWWQREQWRKQLPIIDEYPSCSHTIQSIKDGHLPNHTVHYAPDWLAGNKSGRPKNAERKKSGLELAMNKAKKKMARTKASKGDTNPKKRARTGRMHCQVCGKFNHATKDCFILQHRVMPEVEVDCGATAEMEPVLRESTDMSGEEEMANESMNKITMEERRNEDGMEVAV